MEVIDREQVTEFKLLESTKDAFAFKWPTGRFPLGKFMPVVDSVLLDKLLPAFAPDPSRKDYVFLVHGIRLGWCFTALEAERANARIESLVEENRVLRERLDKLEQSVERLTTSVRWGSIGGGSL